jgi:hypothetical protein
VDRGPYLDDPKDERPRDRRRLGVLWRLLPLVRPHFWRFVLALACLFACFDCRPTALPCRHATAAGFWFVFHSTRLRRHPSRFF